MNSLEYLKNYDGLEDLLLDVVVDGGVEKSWLLSDHSESVSKMLDIELFDVHSIDQNLTSLWIIEAK